MNAPVMVTLTPKETEALVFFIAERKELWARVAEGFGVEDAENVARELIAAHGKAVRREFRARRAA